MKNISIDRIFSKLFRDLNVGVETIDRSDIIEWTGEALEAIGAKSTYQPAVAFLDVTNYTAKLPNLLHAIVQVARNNNYNDSPVTASDILTEAVTEEIDVPVALDQYGMPINEYELAYYRPYFDLIGEFYIGGSFTVKRATFTPVRLSNHSFFGTLVCSNENFEGLYQNCYDEYTLVDDTIKLSFPTGQIAISYLRQAVDINTGYPMIPDTYSNTTAITKYITMKLMEREFYSGRQGSEARMMKSESDWHFYCRQAKNESLLPQTVDEWENLLHQRNYLVPQINRYDGFFGRLSHKENRRLIK